MKHLPDSRKRNHGFWFILLTDSQLHRRENGAGRMMVASGWHQDGTRMAVRRATPTRWHTELESRTTTGHGFGDGEGGLAGSSPGWAHTARDVTQMTQPWRTRFARQSTERRSGGHRCARPQGHESSSFWHQRSTGKGWPEPGSSALTPQRHNRTRGKLPFRSTDPMGERNKQTNK